jgi:hypothetical protein
MFPKLPERGVRNSFCGKIGKTAFCSVKMGKENFNHKRMLLK